MSKILSLSFTLFLLMDAIGNIPLFIALLKNFSPQTQRKIIVRELVFALGILVFFTLIGELFMKFMGIKPYSILIAGGIILFIISIKMIFPQAGDTHDKVAKETEPFIVPLATPLVAGPASIAAVMLFSNQEPLSSTLTAVFIAWLLTTLVLFFSANFKKILGQRGLLACERLMGLLLTLLAVQMFFEGITSYMLYNHIR
ncbi:MAG: NAAT family transporter [Chlamydiae bacterium]|nr:NAAT family transporter [Chlamydiota bacterium]